MATQYVRPRRHPRRDHGVPAHRQALLLAVPAAQPHAVISPEFAISRGVMHIRTRPRLALLALALSSTAILAQQPASPAAPASNRMVLDVVVTPKSGARLQPATTGLHHPRQQMA